MYKEAIVNTFDTIFKNANQLVIKLLIPTIIISIITYFLPQFITPEQVENFKIETANPQVLAIPFIIIFILIMANISIAITTHRISLLGEDSVPKFGSYIFGLREFKFLFKTILFGIIVGIISTLTLLIPIAGIFILPILLILLISRLSLVFPALACDDEMGFIQAWKSTKKFKLLTILMVIIFPVVFSFSVGIVYTFAIEFLVKLISPHLMILYSILNVFIMVFSIAALSSVYKIVRPKPNNRTLKKQDDEIRDIRQSSRRGIHKIIIHEMHNTSFELLKKELEEQYTKLGFTEIAYNRNNAWILKKPSDEEAYVSLRHAIDEYTIHVKNSEEPCLKIIQNSKKKK